MQSGDHLSGRYSFEDLDGTPAAGTLGSCMVQALTATCRWRDSYGAGVLGMTFSADRCSFHGEWSASPAAGN